MFPLQGGSKEVNHSLGFVLGSKHLVTPKKSQIPNMFQDISFKWPQLMSAWIPLPLVIYGIMSIFHPTLTFDWTL